jgi:predicted small metal-binding protein
MSMKITCDCGYTTGESDNHYEVEADIWHHALNTHQDMVLGFSKEQLKEVLKENDKRMGLTK